MTLDQLKYFVAVATYQHVGKAASSVSISPSVISGAISSLEYDLKIELFRRVGRRIELTSNGEKLLNRAREILNSVEGLRSDLQGQPETLVGRYRLGASHFLSSRILLEVWKKITLNHPKLVADFYSMNTAHAIGEVLSGRVDLAICFSPLSHPDLKEVCISKGELQVVVRKNHPILKKPESEKIKFLSSTPATIHKPSQGVEVCETHSVFQRLGFQPKINLYWDSDDIGVESIVRDESWAFVPDIVTEAYQDRIQPLKLPPKAGPATYQVSAIIHKERANDPVLAKLLELMK